MAVFVDDNALLSHRLQKFSWNACSMMHSYDAQLWVDIIWESGGNLKLPTKCSYHFIYWGFLSSGRPSLHGSRVGPALKLLDGRGNSVTLIES
jgi:hypothetical protein